ncbi:MAG: radical SAM protein [Verrucomicrobia subdivision 3 bacterium]|nr:radical SAM protein [Limisphaerales bacterium]
MIEAQEKAASPRLTVASSDKLAPFGFPRNPLGNRYVYAVISPRARGLSVGVNLNPSRHCNFDCIYCEVNRVNASEIDEAVDLQILAAELEHTLKEIHIGDLHLNFPGVPAELLRLRHVALSGDGEPTICPNFAEAVETVVHLRASARVPYFKLVLITNASGLDRLEVKYGISLLTRRDEIWAKLDGGSQAYIDRINRAQIPLEQVLDNIRTLGQQRPVIIQTMIPSIHGANPFDGEIEAYAARLRELKEAGAQISLVQIYSANRPTPHSECGHLPLKTLSEVAKRVRAATGLRTEVF